MVRKPTNQVIAPVLLDNPVLSQWALYQKLGYCINFTVSMSSDPSFLASNGPFVSFVRQRASLKGANRYKADAAMAAWKNSLMFGVV